MAKKVQEFIPIYHQDEVNNINVQADLVILFTKAMQLDTMLTSLQHVLTDNTVVLCLLNGIGHEDVIKQYVDYNNILLGNTMWTAGMEGPGNVTLFGQGSVDLQNLGEGQEQVAKRVADVLTNAGLNARVSQDILTSIYRKACVNGTMNGLCTLLESNMADLGDTTYANEMIDRIVSEFLAVGAQEGVQLNKEEVITQIQGCFNRETIGLHHPSMYQDLILNHRPTEIDYINGAIVRKGEMYGIDTPYCEFLTQLIHCKEEMMDVHQ